MCLFYYFLFYFFTCMNGSRIEWIVVCELMCHEQIPFKCVGISCITVVLFLGNVTCFFFILNTLLLHIKLLSVKEELSECFQIYSSYLVT